MEKKCLILSAMYSLVFGSTLIGQTSYIMRGDTSASVINWVNTKGCGIG